MSGLPSQLPQYLLLLVLLGGYALALADWVRAASEILVEGRRPGFLLCAAALTLLGLMVLFQGIGLGAPRAWGFLSGAGLTWLFQAAALPILIQAGIIWARRCETHPFRAPAGRHLPWLPWPWLAFSLALMLLWTVALARIWPHHLATELPSRLGLGQLAPRVRWPFVITMISLAPILEESLFRHYLLYRFAWETRNGPAPIAASIVLTSVLWALAHHGTLEPYWLKLLQTFGLGTILGLTAWRHGLLTAITLHWAFNLSLIPLSQAMK